LLRGKKESILMETGEGKRERGKRGRRKKENEKGRRIELGENGNERSVRRRD